MKGGGTMTLNHMLRIIYLLYNAKDVLTATAIGEELEMSEQQVRRAINSIDALDTGIDIEIIRGKKGGYRLNWGSFWLQSGLSMSELEALIKAKDFLNEGSGYLLKDEYESGLDKLIAKKRYGDIPHVDEVGTVIYRGYSEVTEREEEIISHLSEAIDKKQRVDVVYFSLSQNAQSQRVIHPYKIYIYKGAYYVAAFCEKRQEIRDFKLSRIRHYKVIEGSIENEPSSKDARKGFDFENYIKNTFGIFKDEGVEVILKIKYPYNHIVKENRYHPEQIIEEVDDNTILFKAHLKGETEIESWILSMGEHCRVIAPESLQKKIQKRYKNIFESDVF